MGNYQLSYDGATIDQKLARMDTLIAEFNALHDAFQAMLGEHDETDVIDTLNEMKQFFANTQNTETTDTVKQSAIDGAMEEVGKSLATVDDLDNLFS